jgi:hypothetical protein
MKNENWNLGIFSRLNENLASTIFGLVLLKNDTVDIFHENLTIFFRLLIKNIKVLL